LLVVGSLLLAVAALSATAAFAAGPTVTTVASGLDNPRGLAFGPDGNLYVAEAGHGGTECVTGGEEGDTCAGLTSQISRINGDGSHTPVVSGLISLASPDGSAATGVDGIAFKGNDLYGIITGSRDAIPPTGFSDELVATAKTELGYLIKAEGNEPGDWDRVANVGHFDFQWAAAHADLVPGQFPDANPYGVAIGPTATWVVDAGANTLDRIDSHGNIKLSVFVPNPASSDSVPTCVAIGRKGAIYLSDLTGGGNPPGSAKVYRYTPKTGLQVWATGLTAVTGCGFGADGKFYAVEFSTLGLDNAAPGTGALVQVKQGSSSPTTIVDGLNFPGGFAAGADGSLYFSDWSIAPAVSGMGAVMKVTLP
jgi:DNA-binding beta-propeller fold protein YncE